MKFKQTFFAMMLALFSLGTPVVLPAVAAAETCGGVDTAIIGGAICGGSDKNATDLAKNPIWAILIYAVRFLTIGVGIAAVGGVVYASILYTSAGSSSEQTQKAKTIIRDIFIGLIAYGGMFLLLNYLIPGGVFQ